MKIKEIIHENTIAFKKLTPVEKVILDAIHTLQEQVSGLMAIDVEVARSVNSIAAQTSQNTSYRKLGKYVTPRGRFNSYSAAATANSITTYMVKKHLKDENNLEYYIDFETSTDKK